MHSNVDSTEFRAWQRGLSDMSDHQIMIGVAMAKDFDGFFSLPAFRELCRSTPATGLPPVEAAYEEACLAPSPKIRAKWSHPAVYHAGRLTGWSDLHAQPRDVMLPRFRYNYDVLKRRVAAGEDINLDVPEAIPKTINRVMPPEQAATAMAKLRAETGI